MTTTNGAAPEPNPKSAIRSRAERDRQLAELPEGRGGGRVNPQSRTRHPVSPESPDPEPVERVEGLIEEAPTVLSRLERRRHLAQIIRVNPMDCFDESGAFDLARAQRILPACAVQSMVIHETTKTDKQGNKTTQRRITLRLVDKVRAMRLDDTLEDKEEKAAHADALKKIARLEKALTEADNRELRYSKDTEKKDRQIESLQRALKLAETTAAVGPEPVERAAAAAGPEPVERVEAPESPDPEPVEGQSRRVESPAEQAERQRRNAEEIAIQCRIREIEHSKNTSGHGGFSSRYPQWPEEAEARRAYALRLIKAEAEAAERQKIASAQRAADRERYERARPPRKRGPIHAFYF